MRVNANGHTILLAEDMESSHEITLALLEPMGFEIDSAENGHIGTLAVHKSFSRGYRHICAVKKNRTDIMQYSQKLQGPVGPCNFTNVSPAVSPAHWPVRQSR